MRENQFQKKVIAFLKDKEVWHIKYWAGSQYTKEGVPDILACIDGTFHGIELKTDVGTESKLQAFNMDGINKNGGEGYVLSPSIPRPKKYKKYDYYSITFEDWKERWFT